MEILLGALAEAIIGLLIADLSQRSWFAEKREKLRGEKVALHRALVGAYAKFAKKYPDLADSLFDEVYLRKREIEAELAKVLTPNGKPDKKLMQRVWQAQLPYVEADITKSVAYFLKVFNEEVKAQPLLKAFVEGRAFEQLYYIKRENKKHTKLLKEIRDILEAIKAAPTSPPPIEPYHSSVQPALQLTEAQDVTEAPSELFGRDALLAAVRERLDKGQNVLLQGFSGAGKTALAGTITAKWIEDGRGAVIWLKAGSAELDGLAEALARPFRMERQMAGAADNEKLKLLRSLLQPPNATLLVLDDCWNGQTLGVLLKGIRGCVPVLMTARQGYPIDGHIEKVPDLPPQPALDLLNFHWGNATHQEDAANLCKKLGYLAFSIEIAGKVLKSRRMTPAVLLSEIENAPHDLKMPLSFAEEGRESVAQLLDVSLKALDEEARNVFLAFGAFFVPSVTAEMLEIYLSPPPDPLPASQRGGESALNRLQDNGLAECIHETENSAAYYRIHDLAYAYAKAQNDEEARGKAVDACLAYTERYNEPSLANFMALRPELDNFMGAAGWAFQQGRWGDAERFAQNLYAAGSEILDYLGFYMQTVTLLAQAGQAAEKQENKYNQGAHLGNLGLAYYSLGQYERAIEYLEQALAISRAIGDRRGEGSDLGNLGNAYGDLGQYERAIEHYQQALAISREIGDRRGEGSDLGNLGNAYGDLGQYERAIEHYQQALAIQREIGDRRGEGNALGNLGNAYASLGQYERAIEQYQQALVIAREIGDKQGEANRLNNIGALHEAQGNYDLAIEFYQQARAIYAALGLAHRVELVDGNIARAIAARDGSKPSP